MAPMTSRWFGSLLFIALMIFLYGIYQTINGAFWDPKVTVDGVNAFGVSFVVYKLARWLAN